MIIQSNYTEPAISTTANPSAKRQRPAAESVIFTDKVTISQTARELSLSPKSNAIDFTATRTAVDNDFLIANNKTFAEIREKQNNGVGVTASELEYIAKATSLPNTMAFLSPEEKGLHDELVASGNSDAALAIRDIAAIRSGTILGGIPELTYDSINTAITPDNISGFFSNSIVRPQRSDPKALRGFDYVFEKQASDFIACAHPRR